MSKNLEAIDILSSWMKAGINKADLKSEEIRVNGDWAIDRGQYVVWKGEEQTDSGKYDQH